MRFEKVWLVIIVVTWREEISSRTACVSGSENGAGPRYVSSVSSTDAPGPPQKTP